MSNLTEGWSDKQKNFRGNELRSRLMSNGLSDRLDQ